MKAFCKEIVRFALSNPTIISTTRKLLKRTPHLEEKVRVWNYLLKKNLFYNKSALIYTTKHQIKTINYHEQKQLLIDISELILRDLHTGIQRVVHGILLELLNNPPVDHYIIKIVYSDALGQLRYANKFTKKLLEELEHDADDSLIEARSGDIFFCPDLHLNYPFATLAALQQRGLHIIFAIHDIIGLRNAHLFPRAYELAFTDWIAGVMSVTDAIVCVSRTVASEVKTWLEEHPGQRTYPLPIGYFHLGANIESSQPIQAPDIDSILILAACRSHPTILMVGTIEPRKGHSQALAAMEIFWKVGMDLNLVIIGKEGWRSQHLARQLRRHPERNQHLFWLENASDSLLIELYKQSSVLLAASFAEGFGLPLIEAAYYGLPIIARDIPIFHEVAGEYAYYFPNTNSSDLAESIQHWLELDAQGNAPQSKGMPYLTWEQSTQQLLKVILEDNWYTTYQPDKVEKTNKSDSTA
ncbi:glycosyltransferase family 4 protein [Acidithiobacillus thiooxidans]|uniref:glycosyltransferase family 4 protein n=1 Tax=Acidithiobacillus thiooxidans TaxID=930 RepID=UPI001C07149D|nr:glycosyltransferase family 1 protein [Acidithiobacillus thiooxidans]MBU2839562.1 glycosyltransferase family 4 protein [Acidithiobacillus thiooxidans]